jgi:cell division protein FtsQ
MSALAHFLSGKVARALAAVFVLAWLSAAGWYGYEAVLSHPVRQVTFVGSTQRLSSAELEALARSIETSPERPSLANVREAARRVRWVRDASVRRVSIDSLEIRFETYEPLARWNDDALVSTSGEVFVADYEGPLPQFRGADAVAPLMTREYPALLAAVAPLASRLVELHLNARGAWQVTLESGLVLELGRKDMEARVARFVSAWPELVARGVNQLHADLRYANGFALQKRENKKTT